MVTVLLVLFGIYTLAVAWQSRRALSARELATRLREAMRLLILSTLGVPLVVAMIVVA